MTEDHLALARSAWNITQAFVLKAAATTGAITALGFTWSNAGLPLPATQGFVRQEVATVVERIERSDRDATARNRHLDASILTLERERIVAQRSRLRFELSANEQVIPTLPRGAVSRGTMERRIGQIRDELGDLDRKDEDLRLRIEKLTAT